MASTLELINGHLIVHFPDGAQLIDTGAPFSVTPSEELQRLIGSPVSRIAGMDQLDGKVLGFDVSAGRIELDPAWQGGEGVGLERQFGVPIVQVGYHGNLTAAILDTGAKLSYAPEEVVNAGWDHEAQWDFCPGLAPRLGEYQVHTSLVTVQIGSCSVDLRVGILPTEIASILPVFGLPQWIVGAELFTRGRVILDLRLDQLAIL